MTTEVELAGTDVNGFFLAKKWLESRKGDQQILQVFQDFQSYDEQMSENHFFTGHQFTVLNAITFSFIATQYVFAVDTVALSSTEITVPLK